MSVLFKTFERKYYKEDLLINDMNRVISRTEYDSGEKELLANLGIREIVQKNGRTSYLRTFDEHDIYVRDETGQERREVSKRFTTFMSRDDVDYVLGLHKEYQRLLDVNVHTALEALTIARDNLGKRNLIELAERKLGTHISNLVRDGDSNSLGLAREVYQKGHLSDSLLERRLTTTERLIARTDYLQRLLNEDLDEGLRTAVVKALENEGKEVTRAGRIYDICIEAGTSAGARMALLEALKDGNRREDLQRAYTAMQHHRGIETEIDISLRSGLPRDLLAIADNHPRHPIMFSEPRLRNLSAIQVNQPQTEKGRNLAELRTVQAGLNAAVRIEDGDIAYRAIVHAHDRGLTRPASEGGLALNIGDMADEVIHALEVKAATRQYDALVKFGRAVVSPFVKLRNSLRKEELVAATE